MVTITLNFKEDEPYTGFFNDKYSPLPHGTWQVPDESTEESERVSELAEMFTENGESPFYDVCAASGEPVSVTIEAAPYSPEAIYKIELDYGRGGYIHGIFIATEQEIENLIGRNVYFGEILGKHSEVSWDFEEKEVKLVTDDPVVIEMFKNHNMQTGYDPIRVQVERETDW